MPSTPPTLSWNSLADAKEGADHLLCKMKQFPVQIQHEWTQNIPNVYLDSKKVSVLVQADKSFRDEGSVLIGTKPSTYKLCHQKGNSQNA